MRRPHFCVREEHFFFERLQWEMRSWDKSSVVEKKLSFIEACHNIKDVWKCSVEFFFVCYQWRSLELWLSFTKVEQLVITYRWAQLLREAGYSLGEGCAKKENWHWSVVSVCEGLLKPLWKKICYASRHAWKDYREVWKRSLFTHVE